MPILVDISQIAIANIMVSPDIKQTAADTNLIKHMVFNSLRLYKQRFKDEYGELVICVDNSKYWRRDYFPHYKWSRKKNREKSEIDWESIHACIKSLLEDLKTYFPYKHINVEGAEADDCIAVIAKNSKEPVVIVGGDKDYKQLHQYAHIKQYSPRKKDFVIVENPKEALQELILHGDDSDGIPNIKSDSDSFVAGKRQKSMYKKDTAIWVKQKPEEYCTSKQMLENYERNRTLIDFDCIPDEVAQRILDAYAIVPEQTKATIMDYFISKGMKNMLAYTAQF